MLRNNLSDWECFFSQDPYRDLSPRLIPLKQYQIIPSTSFIDRSSEFFEIMSEDQSK